MASIMAHKSERIDLIVKYFLFYVISFFLMTMMAYHDEGNWRNYTSYFNFLKTDVFNPAKINGEIFGVAMYLSIPMILLFAVMRFRFRLHAWWAFFLAVLLFPFAVALVGVSVLGLIWLVINVTGMKY